MKVEIEYGKLVASINFMYELKLVRKQSRMRRRFINILNERLKVVEEDRKELLQEHSRKDENGEAIIKPDGNYDVKDMVAFSNDLKELYAEKLVIEGEDNREMISTIKQILKKLENEEYEGQTSEIYDYLCDQFGIDEEIEGGEE
ncbi:hypothetical protein P9246_15675 [Aeribacillus pallidus]|uniref:hypothetical protein n=1 Tax=Aeribacillus composti TaxID=1868734 RepID=UPI002E1C5281|nr:hypothetical protein [Aeribacillus composti]MED4488159.1 hypothetical protein [Aeribacillus pallidus]